MTSDEWRVEMKRLITSVNLTADDRRRIEEVWPEEADECRVVVEDGFLCARFLKTHERFERIRRITGYLTGTLDKWNDAKRAEERDRVKHALRNEGPGCAGNEGPAFGVNEGTACGRNEGSACGGNGGSDHEGEVEGAAADGARCGGVPCGDLAGGASRGPHVVEVAR